MGVDNMNIEYNNDTLDKIYQTKQEKLGLIPDNVKEKFHDVQLEKIKKDLILNIEDEEIAKKILKSIEDLTENYEMKMEYIMENSYKAGFKDAFSLFINCIKN